jgi:hypothetical protein
MRRASVVREYQTGDQTVRALDDVDFAIYPSDVVAVVIGVVAVGGIGLGGEAFKQNQLAAYEGFGGVATVTLIGDPDDEAVGRTFIEQELGRLSTGGWRCGRDTGRSTVGRDRANGRRRGADYRRGQRARKPRTVLRHPDRSAPFEF